MPNAARTFARRAPGGRNQLAGTQSGSLHTGKLSSGEKKVCKNLLFGFFYYRYQYFKRANADGDRNGWGGRNNFGEGVFVKKNRVRLTSKSDSEIEVTG